MQSDQINKDSLFSIRNAAVAVLLLLSAAFVFMAFPHALSGNVDELECINGSVECVVDRGKPLNYMLWIGVFLSSLAGLILLTSKSFDQKKAPTIYVGIATAAALNTFMWMAIVYVGALLIG